MGRKGKVVKIHIPRRYFSSTFDAFFLAQFPFYVARNFIGQFVKVFISFYLSDFSVCREIHGIENVKISSFLLIPFVIVGASKSPRKYAKKIFRGFLRRFSYPLLHCEYARGPSPGVGEKTEPGKREKEKSE